MSTQSNWIDWFVNHPSNDEGNRNLLSFSDILGAGISNDEKLKQLVEEIDTVILAADANKNVLTLHSPKNFGGTRSRPTNKVVCMIGLGVQGQYVSIDLNSALANHRIAIPSCDDLANCTKAEDVAILPVPTEDSPIGFEGSSVFIPCPVIRNAILKANTTDPFELIPVVTAAAKAFDVEHENDETQTSKAITHADDLNAWLYGVKMGLITETRYQLNPDDVEISSFCKERHVQCISGAASAGTAVSFDNSSVISQLTHAISAQNEEAVESNRLRREEIERTINKEEAKKDRTKKIHASIIKMIGRASAKSASDDSLTLPATFTRFINSENVGMAQYELVHQFRELGFPDVGFAQGTVQALFVGDLLYANSSTPSNFTVFAFHEVEPLSNSRQLDYLICQLVQTQGQKKTIEEIKASLKQQVHVPRDFNEMGTQLQIFTAACEIFFGEESIGATSLRQLLIIVGRNKKAFRDHIALDEFFIAKFLFAIDRRVQRWLTMCELASVSRSQVDDRVLLFDAIVEDILNGQFHLSLPATFKKINNSNSITVAAKDDETKDSGGGGKRRKKNQEAGNAVKNNEQLKEFKPASGESWDKNFRSQCPKERPDFDKDSKMCARWHIKGDCFDSCPRALSHVPGSKVTNKQKGDFIAFMNKCRECPPNENKKKDDANGKN